MSAPLRKAAPSALPKAGGADLARRQLERALAIAGGEKHPLAGKVAQAAVNAGAELLLMLPSLDGDGQTAVVRVSDAAGERFLQIDVAESGVTVLETDAIDPSVLKLAQASLDVFQRIGADEALRAPLAAAS